jgi:ketosteroid isomerase-like protein
VSRNLAALREGFEIYARGDFDGLMDLIHDDIVVIRPGGQAPVEGKEAFRAFMEPDAFESQRFEVREMVENGDEILVRVQLHAIGATSGVEWIQEAFHVWTMRDGRGVRLVATFDEAEARRAAGLGDGS